MKAKEYPPVNWSTLRHIRTSPRHYLHYLTAEHEDTEAMRLGRLVHALILEPEKVAHEFVREPRFHRGMKDDTATAKGYDGGKESAKAWDLAHAGKQAVPQAAWDKAESMAEAVRAETNLPPGFPAGGQNELGIEWHDEATGIFCRGRVDHIGAGGLVDLKTAQIVSPRQFASKAASLGYHAQLAFYFDGLAALGLVGADQSPALVVVESQPPFDVVTYRLPPAAIAAGRAMYRDCLEKLAWCRKHDAWPGVADATTVDFELPAWAMPQGEAITIGGEPMHF